MFVLLISVFLTFYLFDAIKAGENIMIDSLAVLIIGWLDGVYPS